MLYSEFIKGTECRDNKHNYKVYKDLEIMYMNSNMSKQEIYEYGKKLVDNSKSEDQKRLEEVVNEDIQAYKEAIKQNRECIRANELMLQVEDDPSWCKEWKRRIKELKEENKLFRAKVKTLKWVIE